MKSKTKTTNKEKNMNSTMIFYYVPDDKDDPEIPNAFMYNIYVIYKQNI